MSRLDELIKQYCPEGVEYYSIGDLFEQFSGMSGVTNKWAESGNCLFIDYMNVYTHIKVDTLLLKNATISKQKQNTLMRGDILFTSASETPDECAISAVIEDEIQQGILLDDHLFGIRPTQKYREFINSSFFNYFFHSKEFKCQLPKIIRGVTRFYISKEAFNKLFIPLPPLSVQEEVVRILDTFTELEAELEAELETRKKQYEYYKEKLLTPKKDWNSFSLSEICEMTSSKRIHASDYVKKGIPFYRGKEISLLNEGKSIDNELYISNSLYETIKDKYGIPHKNDLLMTAVGTLGNTWVVKDETPFYFKDGNLIWFREIKVNVHFLEYLLTSPRGKEKVLKSAIGSAQKALTMVNLSNLEFSFPPLAEQERIVSILDKFDTLCNDISQGLPKELELRRKQYEYYRDKLLTFQRKDA